MKTTYNKLVFWTSTQKSRSVGFRWKDSLGLTWTGVLLGERKLAELIYGNAKYCVLQKLIGVYSQLSCNGLLWRALLNGSYQGLMCCAADAWAWHTHKGCAFWRDYFFGSCSDFMWTCGHKLENFKSLYIQPHTLIIWDWTIFYLPRQNDRY